MRTHRRARTARAAAVGYTAVEVMLAIAILAVGAAGVMSMQKSAIQGNQDARSMDLANAIAHEWVERLRRDATSWTLPSESVPGTANWSTNTVILSQLAASTNAGKWVFPQWRPTAATSWEGYSPAFDILGRDIAPSGGTPAFPGAVFCTQIRVDWLRADEMLRATVRVFWRQQLLAAPAGDFCANDATTAGYPSGPDAKSAYHFVYLTTAIRKNSAR